MIIVNDYGIRCIALFHLASLRIIYIASVASVWITYVIRINTKNDTIIPHMHGRCRKTCEADANEISIISHKIHTGGNG